MTYAALVQWKDTQEREQFDRDLVLEPRKQRTDQLSGLMAAFNLGKRRR